MFPGEGDKAAAQKREEHPCSVGNQEGKKSGLVYSQSTKDLENLGTAVWVLFVSLNFLTCKMENRRLGDEA